MTKQELPKQYNPHDVEQGVYREWEAAGIFAPDHDRLAEGQKPFVIMLPPPNITGNLHMGHALQDTIMDVLIRYHRMKGEAVLWQPGTDHAAIATNKVIENQLHQEGKTRWDVGYEEFMQRTQAWYEKTGAEILQQMRRLGASCDWSRTRFTMDDEYYRAVQEAFVRYYQQGLIYRGARIVNWDPTTQTTVSDLEIDWQTEKTSFYFLQYGPFEIGTARPETKFGDKYVVMHPDDKRYQQYKHGDTFVAEWINGPVTATIIKDEAADPNFGSGVMTITPWHDATDFEIAQRHHLDMEQIIDLSGKLLPIAGEFAGQDIAAARSQIIAKLQSKGLLLRVDESYEHNIARNDRGKGVIEPQVMRQWFVDMSKLKDETISVAEQDIIKFVPPRWKKHFLNWMYNVKDWNINRQIWLGHRLPVWWKPNTHGTDHEEGNFTVSLERPGDGEDWQQDPDVLDTWFSSALWPFATLGWPNNTDDLQKFYPTSVLVTGRDILPLWVARMIFSGLQLMKGEAYGNLPVEKRIPFHEVFIHPTVLTKDGKRMSKSLGTGIDPLELINEYGADATRFGLMRQMSYDSQAIRFDSTAIVAARNFANKIWNLARLLDALPEQENPTIADQWIEDRATQTQQQVTELLDQYKIGEATHVLYDFIWNDFADWYVEILKVQGSITTARHIFNRILTMLHPFMPHLTEALWAHQGNSGLLAIAPWGTEQNIDPVSNVEAATAIQAVQETIERIRSARIILGIPASAMVEVHAPQTALPIVVEALAKAKLMDKPDEEMKFFPLSAGGSVGIASEHITTDSVRAASQKLDKELQRLTQQVERLQQAVTSMRGKAMPEVVEEKEAALQRLQTLAAEVAANRAALG